MKIFIFDNDRGMIEKIAKVLEINLHLQIDFTDDGEEALQKIQNNGTYNLVILEVLSMKVSGIELCRILSERYKDMPVILISELPLYSEKFRLACQKYPELSVVRGVLQKPFSPQDLLLKINSIIKQS